jgi:N6-adenosine-specific RNA methylase IME4
MALPARLARELVKASPLALRLRKDLPFGLWKEIGQQICAIERGVQWRLGDWWGFGNAAYGERAKAAAANGIFGHSFQSLMIYGSVCRAFPETFRRLKVPFAHHLEVAALRRKDEAQADALLDEAEGRGLRVLDLRARVDAVRHHDRLAENEKNSLGNGPLLTGRRFPVIYADPPWRYENADPRLAAENHYSTMSLDEICALQLDEGLPVKAVAHRNAILYLWVTNQMLPDGFKVIDAWGFEYWTNMVWVKDRPGMGHYTRGQHELLLIAKRGNIPAPLNGTQPSSVIESVIEAPRRKHSEKPKIVYELIDGLYPGVGKIELFARRAAPRAGWVFWGNQANRLDSSRLMSQPAEEQGRHVNQQPAS